MEEAYQTGLSSIPPRRGGGARRRRGITVGTVELILAAVAIRLPVPVWSFDVHFQAIARHGARDAVRSQLCDVVAE